MTSMRRWLLITAPLAELTVKQLENWDSELQLIEQQGYEPYEASDAGDPTTSTSRLSVSYLF
jgi:hypothetical protein